MREVYGLIENPMSPERTFVRAGYACDEASGDTHLYLDLVPTSQKLFVLPPMMEPTEENIRSWLASAEWPTDSAEPDSSLPSHLAYTKRSATKRVSASNPQRLLDVEQAAAYLSITPVTLYHWVAKRYIPFVKLGSKAVRFDLRELERWVDLQSRPSGKQVQHDGRIQARKVLLGHLLP